MRAILAPALFPLILSVAATVATAQAPAPAATEIAPGWRGDPAVWRRDGDMLIGSTQAKKIKANTFLIRDGELSDFDLRLRVRMEGGNNSGVQYRSRVLPGDGFRVGGYQCDLHPTPNYTAMLYDEQGAGIVARRGQCMRWTDAGPEVLGKLARVEAVDLTQWHELRIVGRGNVVWHELDGRVVTAVQDLRQNAPPSGVIALQLHAGVPMQVWFADVQVQALDASSSVAVPDAVQALLRRADLAAGQPQGLTPRWIWDQTAEAEEELFCRRAFELAAVPATARLSISCDNHCRVYVNGERVGESDAWEAPLVVDVAASLLAGENVLAVHGWNAGGPAGLAVRLSWQADGTDRELVSNGAWRCSDDDPDGWDRPGFDDSQWAKVRVLATLGQQDAPWSSRLGADALGSATDVFAPQVAVLDTELDGSATTIGPVLRLLDVPRALGSWVALGEDDQGRLYASDQQGGLYRIVPALRAGELTTFERVPVQLGGANGLLWWRASLYAVVNDKDSGLYRLTDTDGDDMLDHVELLRALDGRGEHGPHSVVVAPDGEHLLVLCGNQTRLPELSSSRVPTNWQEDRPVPRLDDPHKYWEGHSPPGGWVCQVDPDGKQWELICCGFRNPYDLVVLSGGLIVVYDADMEWDMGLPWYRPTRLLKVQSGVDYGWRIGSAKWPVDYPDAPPALLDIGPGSPVGMAPVVTDGRDESFLCLDWTFGTVYSVALQSGRWGGSAVPVAFGVPWPVADVVVGQHGTFVVAGGRGLPSTLTRLEIRRDETMSDAIGDVRTIGEPWLLPDPRVAVEHWSRHGDEWPVYARIALESVPVATWREAVLAVDTEHVRRSLAGLLALSRQGEAADLQPLLDALGGFSFAGLGHLDRIAWLRVHALALMRLGPPGDPQRQLVADRLLPLFPTGDERQDQDLCELLAYVDAKGLLDKAVPLLTPLQPSPPPAWAEVITRNETYGGVIAKMIADMPPIGQLALANALRTVERGWTLEQRRTLFTFLGEARKRSGGSSYDGFLQRMIDAAWATCTPAEQQALAEVAAKAKEELPKFESTPPKGPGKDWQIGDIPALTQADLAGHDVAAGRNLFHAIGCASCHYFAGEGGFGGPDLTSLGNKFTASDVLEAILDPNKVISDQYSGQVLTRTDGSALFGVVRKMFDGDNEVYEVIPAVADSKPVRIAVADVAKVEPSPLSPMPSDLIDRLSADEVKHLLAFLLSRGKQ